jgi:hypothetical protein
MMLRRTILGVLVALFSGCAFGQSICTARTPEQALPLGWTVQANSRTVPPDAQTRASRYRLVRVVADPVLHRRWAFIGNCMHPEWPLQLVAFAPGSDALSTSDPDVSPAVKALSVSTEPVPSQTAVAHPVISISTQPSPPLTAPNYAQPSAPASSATTLLVRAGDRVHLWSSDANVRLEMEVVALEYGRVGQVIHLRRTGQTALIAGVVVGKDSVELMP